MRATAAPTATTPTAFLMWLIPLLLAALALASPAQAQQTPQRVALLVGNASYSVGRLTNPPNDVAAMELALKRLNFKVQTVLNANQNQMKRAVRDFGTAAQGADVAFMYFSGHGTQANGENYLLPVGASIDKESDYAIEAIAANDVLAQIRGAGPKAAILVLDACRDNPLAATTRSTTKGLGRMDAPTGTMIAFATAPNTVASDNGDYAKVLARELQKPGQELIDVFRNTTAEVRRLSAGKQEPRISEMSISERLYLAGPGTQVASVVPEPARPSAAQLEQQAWDAAQSAGTAAALQAYVAEYPRGAYAGVARVRLAALARPVQPEAVPQPAAAPAPVQSTARQPFEPEMVSIAPGSFTMGSSADEQAAAVAEGATKAYTDRESPQHTVRIGYRFALGKYEVSRGEFARFVTATAYKTEAEKGDGCFVLTAVGSDWEKKADANWKSPGFAQADDHPVVCVSWNDAQAYISWLNQQQPSQGYRLPSEAEWEYAARAGSNTRYPWGEDKGKQQICRQANHGEQSYSAQYPKDSVVNKNCSDGVVHTAAGKQFPANAFGLHNMHGNVWEWVQDVWHDNYNGAPTDGSTWVSGGDQSLRVRRGGSWSNFPQSLRSAIRFWDSPAGRVSVYGFRLARTVP